MALVNCRGITPSAFCTITKVVCLLPYYPTSAPPRVFSDRYFHLPQILKSSIESSTTQNMPPLLLQFFSRILSVSSSLLCFLANSSRIHASISSLILPSSSCIPGVSQPLRPINLPNLLRLFSVARISVSVSPGAKGVLFALLRARLMMRCSSSSASSEEKLRSSCVRKKIFSLKRPEGGCFQRETTGRGYCKEYALGERWW